jgi:hypothetical protein
MLAVPRFWLVKVRLLGLMLPTGAPPVPVRVMVCGLPVRESETLKAAVRVPVAVGVNVTLTMQLLPEVPAAARDPLHVAGKAKSPGLVPASVMLITVKGTVPVLAMVTGWAALVEPTF